MRPAECAAMLDEYIREEERMLPLYWFLFCAGIGIIILVTALNVYISFHKLPVDGGVVTAAAGQTLLNAFTVLAPGSFFYTVFRKRERITALRMMRVRAANTEPDSADAQEIAGAVWAMVKTAAGK